MVWYVGVPGGLGALRQTPGMPVIWAEPSTPLASRCFRQTSRCPAPVEGVLTSTSHQPHSLTPARVNNSSYECTIPSLRVVVVFLTPAGLWGCMLFILISFFCSPQCVYIFVFFLCKGVFSATKHVILSFVAAGFCLKYGCALNTQS